MEYIASQLAPLHRGVPDFYKNQDLMIMVSNAIDGSRMAFMNEAGEVYTIGNFIEDCNGIKYSNHSFERVKTFRDFDYSGWTKDSWETYEKYCTYRQKPLMWLSEADGEVVLDTKGSICWNGDFAIDESGHVYEYDYELDAMIYCKDFRAYGSDYRAVKFDPDSDRTIVELIADTY